MRAPAAPLSTFCAHTRPWLCHITNVSSSAQQPPKPSCCPVCRRDLWDVAFSGPLVGGLASLALLLAGYYASSPEITARELLVAVPKPLFQGSLLLGTMTKLVLPSDLLNGQEVLIHPLSIAGWCGMITTALNLLPVGCLDGGRMVQVRSARTGAWMQCMPWQRWSSTV